MEIRKICEAEMKTALQLIWETFLEFEAPDYSRQGIKSFHDFISNQDMIKRMEFVGAFDSNELRGIIAARDESDSKHICCFFVSALYQKQGIGRQLWEYLKANSNKSEYTVNSSPYAVAVYHNLGFVDTDTEQLTDGIRYTPMKYIRQG